VFNIRVNTSGIDQPIQIPAQCSLEEQMLTFDIFEITPDGYIWRCSVQGQFEKERKLQELAETSDNQFCAVDLDAGELPPVAATPRNHQIDEVKIRRASNS
jgi:hypothetical protein